MQLNLTIFDFRVCLFLLGLKSRGSSGLCHGSISPLYAYSNWLNHLSIDNVLNKPINRLQNIEIHDAWNLLYQVYNRLESLLIYFLEESGDFCKNSIDNTPHGVADSLETIGYSLENRVETPSYNLQALHDGIETGLDVLITGCHARRNSPEESIDNFLYWNAHAVTGSSTDIWEAGTALL